MNDRQRRVRSIELTLTPREVVLVWLRDAMQAGTIEESARHSPPHRGAIANTVLHIVQTSMKGQPESLIEQAILQARREADLLYLLIVKANMAALEGWPQRRREYVFLLGYLTAEMNEKTTKNRVQTLRLAVLAFLKSVIMLDASIAQLVTERAASQCCSPTPRPSWRSNFKWRPICQHGSTCWQLQLVLRKLIWKSSGTVFNRKSIEQSRFGSTKHVWECLVFSVQEVHAAMDQVFLRANPNQARATIRAALAALENFCIS